MISQRKIKIQYDKMEKRYSDERVPPNRVNCYQCECEHITKTIDIDPGVTPMMFACEKCGEIATSSWYKDIAPEQKPTIEWYRPTLKECMKLRRKNNYGEQELDHIFSGGLKYRKIENQ